ncbi:MAG: hypothetical protein U0625_12065 [Phycisphaerales bacterium]
MPSRFHQLLATLLACWLPFCCCQARAAADALAHAVCPAEAGTHASAGAAERTLPPCCRARAAERASHALDASHAAPSCCDRGGTDGKKAPAGSCSSCAGCKERGLPGTTPTIDHDSIGTLDVAVLVLALDAALPARIATAVPGMRCDTGPPTPQPGRLLLALHSQLVI